MINRMLTVPVLGLPMQSRLIDRHFHLVKTETIKPDAQVTYLTDLRYCLVYDYMKKRDSVGNSHHTKEEL